MNDQVAWVIELSIERRHRPAFRAWMAKMVASARREPGTLDYEWFFSRDGGVCHIHERYANSAAARAHAATFDAKFAKRFFALAKATRVCVYGTPDAPLRATFEGLDARFLAPTDGFRR